LATNCEIASTNPRVVTVVSNDTTTAEFTMFCARRVGRIRVGTQSSGVDLDPDGYVASVVGGPSQAIPLTGSVVISNIREGQHTVELTGVEGNCAILGAANPTVFVQFGATVDVIFVIECVRFGSLDVSVASTGVEPDADGYVIDLRAASLGVVVTLPVAPNGMATFPRLRPAPDYRVTLQGIVPSCDVSGGDVQTVTVSRERIAGIAFSVVCQSPRVLAYVSDGDVLLIASNGTVTTRLTSDAGGNRQPACSPGGERIAFARTDDGGETDLYTMHADGTNLVGLTSTAGHDDAPS
jgi:hypothetical protein